MDKVRQIAAEIIDEVEEAIIEGNNWVRDEVEDYQEWRTLLTEQEYSRLEALISGKISEVIVNAMFLAINSTVGACNRILKTKGQINGEEQETGSRDY